MAIAATIAVDIVARTAEFQSAMSNLSDRLDRVGQNITATGQKLTGAFTVPLAAATAGIYKAVEAAADLEETQNAVGVVFGETTPQILAFAETAATSFGQSTEEALRAAQTFGMFGQAAGLSGQQTVQFSTELVQLAAEAGELSIADVLVVQRELIDGLGGYVDARLSLATARARLLAAASLPQTTDLFEEDR
jgi:hypothetical protein